MMKKLFVARRNASEAARIDLRVILVLGCFAASAAMPYAAAPDWWSSRGLTKPGSAANDYGVANQGQLKNMVRAACDELLAKGYIDTSHAIYQQVQSWRTNTANAKDYGPVNLGQLKAVAKPIYDVLKTRDSSINYPWSSVSTDDKDYAVANIGQLKNVFSFAIPELVQPILDSDGDGIPDDWEIAHGLNPNNPNDASISLNRDGPTALQNYQRWAAGNLAPDGDADDDGVLNYMDADPTNPAVGQLSITITSPASQITF